MRIALCAGDFRDAGGGDAGVAVGVTGRLGGDSRSQGSMIDGYMDMDAGDVEVGLPCRANRRIMEERLDVMERCNGTF